MPISIRFGRNVLIAIFYQVSIRGVNQVDEYAILEKLEEVMKVSPCWLSDFGGDVALSTVVRGLIAEGYVLPYGAFTTLALLPKVNEKSTVRVWDSLSPEIQREITRLVKQLC